MLAAHRVIAGPKLRRAIGEFEVILAIGSPATAPECGMAMLFRPGREAK